MPAESLSWLITRPLKSTRRLVSAGMIRFSTAKLVIVGSFWKVAVLPCGRKLIGPVPVLSVGVQLMIACGTLIVIVSLPDPITRSTLAGSKLGVPWNAWAEARCAGPAASGPPPPRRSRA